MSFFAVLIASLLGSPHCGAMCGGFSALYSVSQSPSSTLRHLQYHVGRLITYLSLGCIAGFVGRSVDVIAESSGIHRFASIMVGAGLIYFGLKSQLFPRFRLQIFSRWIGYFTVPLHAFLREGRGRPLFPFFLGIVSTLLPCGWLYGYIAVAGATGSPISAMVVMFFFWVGTVPILLAIGIGAHRLFPISLKNYPRLAALLLVLAGTFSLSGHLQLPIFGSDGSSGHCHHADAASAGQ